MTYDLNKLADALTRDTLDKVLQEKIANERDQILQTLERGEQYVLDAQRGIVISAE